MVGCRAGLLRHGILADYFTAREGNVGDGAGRLDGRALLIGPVCGGSFCSFPPRVSPPPQGRDSCH